MEHQTFKRNKKSNLDYKIGFNDGRRFLENNFFEKQPVDGLGYKNAVMELLMSSK